MFNFQGDFNGRHNLPGKPMLDPITGTLMVLGVGLSLWRIRNPKFLLILTWFFLMLAPGIFSLDYESPQSLRAIGSMPAAYLLASVPIEWIWQKSEKSAKKYLNYMFIVDMVILLGMSTVINFNIYFHQQANSIDSWISFSTPETIAGNIMADLDNKVEYYVSSYYFQTPTIQFLAPKVTDYHMLETYETLPILSTSQKDMVFLLSEDQKLFFDQAQRFYPSAIFKEHTGPDGSTVLYEIYLSQADILASQGLTASYYLGENWSGKPFLVRTEKNLDFELIDGEPASFPFSIEWTGIVFAPIYGNYKFVVQSPALLELVIDNFPVVFNGTEKRTGEISLAKGCHTIVVRTVGIAGSYKLEWQPPEENLEPIPQSVLLLPPFTNNGLLGQYYDNPNWEGSPVFTQIDPWISFYFHNPPLSRPYTIEWSGRIYISGGGNYYFGLESIDESSLWIDEKQIIDNKTPNLYQEAGIFLTPGFHPIRVLFTDRTGYTHIYLYWSPPNLEQGIIPQYVLFPPIGDP